MAYEVTKASLNVVLEPYVAPTYFEVTKASLNVVLMVGAMPEMTQLTMLAAAELDASVSVTQLTTLGVVELKPLPLPIPVVPDIPLRETWSYSTVLNIAEKGTEQRAALWAYPKCGMKFTAILIGEIDRRVAYDLIARLIGQVFNYPLYMYSAKMAVAAAIGDTKLYFTPSSTNLRDGEMVALFDPALERTHLVTLATVDADGGTLASPLAFDVPANWLICPAPFFRLMPNADFTMNNIDGEIELTLVGSSVRPVLRPNQSGSLLTTYDGMVVLDKRPLADDKVDTEFNRNVTWLDTGAVTPVAFMAWKAAYISGDRAFKVERPAGLDYWRAFASYTRGRQKPFLVPTYRNDLPLASTPALSATTLVTSNYGFKEYSGSLAYRYVRIQSTAGVIYRRVEDVRLNYDPTTGVPVSANILLDASIGAGVGANANMVVSFANTCRMDSDTIALDHEAVDTIVNITIRAVEA